MWWWSAAAVARPHRQQKYSSERRRRRFRRRRGRRRGRILLLFFPFLYSLSYKAEAATATRVTGCSTAAAGFSALCKTNPKWTIADEYDPISSSDLIVVRLLSPLVSTCPLWKKHARTAAAAAAASAGLKMRENLRERVRSKPVASAAASASAASSESLK